MGFHYEDKAPQRWQCRSLSAKAPDSLRNQVPAKRGRYVNVRSATSRSRSFCSTAQTQWRGLRRDSGTSQ